jgi:hypothetical protein
MAKKKSLKERIDALINALGAAEKPSPTKIRNELVSLSLDVEALEGSKTLAEKDARIADLEGELGGLSVTLKEANSELEAFRAAQRKQQEQERKKDIPPAQLNILRRLPSKHGGKGLTVQQIWREVGGRLDELDIHVEKLDKAKLITWRTGSSGETFWLRSTGGNELVVAKRLAGEEEEEEVDEQEEGQPEITQMEYLVLLAVAQGCRLPAEIEEYIQIAVPTVGPPITTPNMMLLLLIELRGKKMVSDAGKPSGWKLLRAGTRFLASRGKL